MSKHLTHYSLMNANLSKTCTKYLIKQLSNLHEFNIPVLLGKSVTNKT